MMFNKQYKLITLLLLSTVHLQAQSSLNTQIDIGKVQEQYQREKVICDTEKIGSKKKSLLLTRQDRKLVLLSFWNEFNDTLVVYIDHKKTSQFLRFSDSTQFDSFKSTNIYLKINKPIKVRIELLKKKKFVDFVISNKVPMITIQRYGEVWYINSRYYSVGYEIIN